MALQNFFNCVGQRRVESRGYFPGVLASSNEVSRRLEVHRGGLGIYSLLHRMLSFPHRDKRISILLDTSMTAFS